MSDSKSIYENSKLWKDKSGASLSSISRHMNAYCEFVISINYPIMISNCLPFELKYKFLDWDTFEMSHPSYRSSRKTSVSGNSFLSSGSKRTSGSKLTHRDNVSILALSNIGSQTIGNIMNNPELKGHDGEIQNATTHNILTTSPHEYPILTISTENQLFNGIPTPHSSKNTQDSTEAGVFRGILKLQRAEQYQKIKRKYHESEKMRSSMVSNDSVNVSPLSQQYEGYPSPK